MNDETVLKKEALEMLESRKGYTPVICSPGYGAGFTSWNTQLKPHDEAMIRAIIEEGTVTEVFDDGGYDDDIEVKIDKASLAKIIEKLGYPTGHLYLGCCEDAFLILFVKKGNLFRINEYDGNESIEVFNSDSYFTA
jgi:hypothetical protein